MPSKQNKQSSVQKKTKTTKQMPGAFKLFLRALKTYKQHLKILGGLTLLYLLGRFLVGGLPSSDTYLAAKDVFGSLAAGNLSGIVGTGAVIASAFSGLFTPVYSGEQQLLINILGIAFWLTAIWAMRQLIAGNTVTIRLALYNSMAPLVPLLIVVFILVLQLIPAALGALLFSYVWASPFAGFETLFFTGVAVLLMTLSLYLITQSLLALVIVTLPNTYPIAALKSAKQLIEGRRVLLLRKLFGLAVAIALMWIAVSLPFLLFEVLTGSRVPLIPLVAELLTGFTFAISTVYLYLLYRELL